MSSGATTGRGRGDRAAGGAARWGPVPILLAGILAALVGLVVVLATQRGGDAAAALGQGLAAPEARVVRRSDLPSPPAPPKPIDDPDRIREALRVGRTYSSVLKVGLTARAEDKSWWRKEVVALAYVAELAVDRAVESNDGRRVVEGRRFVAARNAKLLCDVESASIDLGAPGVLLLGALASLHPGAAGAVVAAKPVADALLRRAEQSALRGEAARAVGRVASISGKRVRIAYVDGRGVESIEPVGCALSPDEVDFVFATAVLSDCYLWDMRLGVGRRWSVDGAQLVGLLDPTLRGAASGEVRLVRDPDGAEAGRAFALLRIEGGSVTVAESGDATRRVATFAPEGTLAYGLDEKAVVRARLTGRIAIESVSTDHILFETSFRSRPMLTVDYSCSVR